MVMAINPLPTTYLQRWTLHIRGGMVLLVRLSDHTNVHRFLTLNQSDSQIKFGIVRLFQPMHDGRPL